jgi:hemerythrin-like domain-containing protein
MSETHPTEVLRDEHRWILGVAEALEGLLGARPERLDHDRVAECIRFIRLFADACHHGKEEDLLFPALEACGMSREAGPIAVMLHEHRLGREHVAAMSRALAGSREGDPADRARLLHAGRAYIDLIRHHILKEDHVLFEMADQMVEGETRRGLCEAYDGTCAHTFDGCTKAQLEALGREILSWRGSPA